MKDSIIEGAIFRNIPFSPSFGMWSKGQAQQIWITPFDDCLEISVGGRILCDEKAVKMLVRVLNHWVETKNTKLEELKNLPENIQHHSVDMQGDVFVFETD